MDQNHSQSEMSYTINAFIWIILKYYINNIIFKKNPPDCLQQRISVGLGKVI